MKFSGQMFLSLYISIRTEKQLVQRNLLCSINENMGIKDVLITIVIVNCETIMVIFTSYLPLEACYHHEQPWTPCYTYTQK